MCTYFVHLLSKCKIEHYLVVEHCEEELYQEGLKEHVNLMSMGEEFDNLGEGSIPVRKWVDRKAKELRVEKYWCLDDNIDGFCYFLGSKSQKKRLLQCCTTQLQTSLWTSPCVRNPQTSGGSQKFICPKS